MSAHVTRDPRYAPPRAIASFRGPWFGVASFGVALLRVASFRGASFGVAPLRGASFGVAWHRAVSHRVAPHRAARAASQPIFVPRAAAGLAPAVALSSRVYPCGRRAAAALAAGLAFVAPIGAVLQGRA